MVSPSSAGRLGRAAAGHRRDLRDQRIDLALRRLGVAAGGLDQPGGHALLVVEQRLQQMRRRDPLMMLANRDRLRRLQEAARAVGELFEIHSISTPLASGGYGVAHRQHKSLRVSCGCAVSAAVGVRRRRWRVGVTAADLARQDAGARLAGSGWPTVAASSGWTIGGHSRGNRRIHVPAPELGACRRGSGGRRRSRARR